MQWWRPRLLANCFLLFCGDLAVLIFLTLLASQRPYKKSAQGPNPVGRVTYSSGPFAYKVATRNTLGWAVLVLLGFVMPNQRLGFL